MRLHVLLLSAALSLACGSGTTIDDPEPAGGDDAGAGNSGSAVDDAGSSDDAGTGTELDGGSEEFTDAGYEPPDRSEDDGGDWGPGDDDAGVEEPADAGTVDGGSDGGTPVPTTALLRPYSPLPCADPAVFSQGGAGQVFFVYCTGMVRVWRTTDWIRFSDVRSSVTFTLTGMSANGKQMGSWWAPAIIYSPALQKYVMWVAVPDAQGTNDGTGWDTRSLAVLTATSPTGPWIFAGLALDAAAGQRFIDPFLFIDHDGGRYVYWKQFGTGISSRIMGARVNAAWTAIDTSSRMEVMNGFGGPGTWEDNVRENPAVWYDPSDGRHHMLFSGGHWFNGTYATGHAISGCGPLCPRSTTGGWHMLDSGDRGILQVVRAFGNPDFTNGGPGGAEFQDASGEYIVYAAAAKSAAGVKTRYLMRDRIQWKNRAPYVDTPGHEPLGY